MAILHSCYPIPTRHGVYIELNSDSFKCLFILRCLVKSYSGGSIHRWIKTTTKRVFSLLSICHLHAFTFSPVVGEFLSIVLIFQKQVQQPLVFYQLIGRNNCCTCPQYSLISASLATTYMKKGVLLNQNRHMLPDHIRIGCVRKPIKPINLT